MSGWCGRPSTLSKVLCENANVFNPGINHITTFKPQSRLHLPGVYLGVIITKSIPHEYNLLFVFIHS